jgi:hypothetical protein
VGDETSRWMRERGKIPYNIDVQSADEKGRKDNKYSP